VNREIIITAIQEIMNAWKKIQKELGVEKITFIDKEVPAPTSKEDTYSLIQEDSIIDPNILHDTGKAYLIKLDKNHGFWLAKSHIESETDDKIKIKHSSKWVLDKPKVIELKEDYQ